MTEYVTAYVTVPCLKANSESSSEALVKAGRL